MSKQTFSDTTSIARRSLSAPSIAAAKDQISTVALPVSGPKSASLTLADDTGMFANDYITYDGRVNISGIEAGSTWRWSEDKGLTWSTPYDVPSTTLTLEGEGQKSLYVKVKNISGEESLSTISFTLKQTIAPLTVEPRRSISFLNESPSFAGYAEKGALLTIRNIYGSTEVLDKTRASETDGSWSLNPAVGVHVTGLTKADGSDSSANGFYSLVSVRETLNKAAIFSKEYSDSGAYGLDTTKRLFQKVEPDKTWYLWETDNNRVVISPADENAEWYRARMTSTVPNLYIDWEAVSLRPSHLKVELSQNNGKSSHTSSLDNVLIELPNIWHLAHTAPWFTFAIEQQDTAGNEASSWVHSFVDSLPPPLVDVNPKKKGIQTSHSHFVDSNDLKAGVQLLEIDSLPERRGFIESIKIQLSGTGLDTKNDRLILDTEYALDKSFGVAEDRVVGGVNRLRYQYDSDTKTLLFNDLGGLELSNADVTKIVHSIRVKNPNGSSGERVAAISIDLLFTDPKGPSSFFNLMAARADLSMSERIPGQDIATETSRHVTKAADLAKGISFYKQSWTAKAEDIAVLQVGLSGKGLDVLNDKIIIDKRLNLDKSVTHQKLAIAGGKGDLEYSYDTASRTLLFKSSVNRMLGGEEVKLIANAIKLANDTPLDGERIAHFQLIASNGETGAPNSARLVLDTQAPELDLDYSKPGVQARSHKVINQERAEKGEHLFAKTLAAPVAEDISRITLKFSGSSKAKTSLSDSVSSNIFDNSIENLDQDFLKTSGGSRRSDGLENISAVYKAQSRELTFHKLDAPMSGLQAKALLDSVKLFPNFSLLEDRNVDITVSDTSGNTSSARASISLDASLLGGITFADYGLASGTYKILTIGDILGNTNTHNLQPGEGIRIVIPKKSPHSYLTLAGISAEWGGMGITGNANTTSSSYKSYLTFNPENTGQSTEFDLIHQGGTFVKGARFWMDFSHGILSLNNNESFYHANTDLYEYDANPKIHNQNYDIGNIKILYREHGNSMFNRANPKFHVALNSTSPNAGDVVSLHDKNGQLASKILTTADINSTAAWNEITVPNSMKAGIHSIYAKYTEVSGNTKTSDPVFIQVATGAIAPALTHLKVSSPNSNAPAQELNDSEGRYAAISDPGTSWAIGNYDKGLVFSGRVGAEGSSEKFLVTVSMGGKVLAFDIVNAGVFSLTTPANLLAPGYYDDLSITAVNASSGSNQDLSTTVQGLKLGHYWAAQSLGDTRGGHGNDNFLLGATKNGLNTLIQTNGGNDTLTLGAFGKQGNLAATVTDFTAGADKIAVFGKSIDLGNLSQFVKEVAPIQGGNGTKVVVDLDGAAAGNQTYTLHLQNVAYQPANTHTLFGV